MNLGCNKNDSSEQMGGQCSPGGKEGPQQPPVHTLKIHFQMDTSTLREAPLGHKYAWNTPTHGCQTFQAVRFSPSRPVSFLPIRIQLSPRRDNIDL